jgi:hypothetical protein
MFITMSVRTLQNKETLSIHSQKSLMRVTSVLLLSFTLLMSLNQVLIAEGQCSGHELCCTEEACLKFAEMDENCDPWEGCQYYDCSSYQYSPGYCGQTCTFVGNCGCMSTFALCFYEEQK